MPESLRLLSYRDLEMQGYGSRVTIWRKVRTSEFPPPLSLGNGRVAWREQDIIEWLESLEIAEIGKQARA